MIFGPVPPKHETHSPECKLVEPKQMQELNVIEQGYILRCHHWSHTAVKMMYKGKV